MKVIQQLANVIIDNNDVNLPEVNVTDNTVPDVLTLVFTFAGAIAFIVIVVGGLQYVISQGNPQATSKAKDTILYALVGLIICISAVAIISFVVQGVT